MFKMCINCHTENPLDAALCSECGMSLRGAPAAESAMKLREQIEEQSQRTKELAEQWRSRVEESPSASDIVYLFGDLFVSKHGKGEELTWRGVRVEPKPLANQLLLAAFVHLASMGYIRMERIEYKWLGILTRLDIGVVRLGEPRKPLHGLEAAIWESISDDPKETRVIKIIQRIIGSEITYPWSYIVWKAKEGLLGEGYLARQVEELPALLWFRRHKAEWSADEELIAAHKDKAEEVKAMLASFEADAPQLYGQLGESVRKGIESMVKRELPSD